MIGEQLPENVWKDRVQAVLASKSPHVPGVPEHFARVVLIIDAWARGEFWKVPETALRVIKVLSRAGDIPSIPEIQKRASVSETTAETYRRAWLAMMDLGIVPRTGIETQQDGMVHAQDGYARMREDARAVIAVGKTESQVYDSALRTALAWLSGHRDAVPEVARTIFSVVEREGEKADTVRLAEMVHRSTERVRQYKLAFLAVRDELKERQAVKGPDVPSLEWLDGFIQTVQRLAAAPAREVALAEAVGRIEETLSMLNGMVQTAMENVAVLEAEMRRLEQLAKRHG